MIKTITEQKRGCGYRKKGGLYLFAGGKGSPCGKLPVPVHVCPSCGNGVKPGRGFQWIKWEFLRPGPCSMEFPDSGNCSSCPLGSVWDAKLGLMWVGEKYYPTPADFVREADSQGLSKRIPALPHDFVLGKTWLAVAHRKAVTHYRENEGHDRETWTGPGVFALYLPTEIQYIVRGDETPEFLQGLEKKGITPVNVEYEGEEMVEFEKANAS